MKRNILLILLISIIGSFTVNAALTDNQQKAIQDIKRSKDIIDATWKTCIKGHSKNMYLVDTYDTQTGAVSGPSDVWPYTAAIEAHCSILEALDAIKDIDPALYNENFELYKSHLEQLIDNLEFYRGSYRLSSYATSDKEWSPFAVPRASSRGAADVSGILNVYDDQMWLARELIRAYRLTNNDKYLSEATYLTDYVLEGWDCWRDESGNEYGGITWGPGYNSKHACSNAPIIQPLVWLYDIYNGSDDKIEYFYRDKDNKVVKDIRPRAEHYLDFAKRVYDWQKTNLLHQSGVYWDMMGADNTITVLDGYRQHMDCGNPTGSLISYNTGTMISGATELFKATKDFAYKSDMEETSKSALNQFSKYVRKYNAYDFATDNTAEKGFTSWFNNVLMRSFADAYPHVANSSAKNALNSFQTALDYAYENHNRDNLLPIHFFNGWGDETVTKGFHQFSFASEYAVLSKWRLAQDTNQSSIQEVEIDPFDCGADVYTIQGVLLGTYSEIKGSIKKGIYIVGNKKMYIGQ